MHRSRQNWITMFIISDILIEKGTNMILQYKKKNQEVNHVNCKIVKCKIYKNKNTKIRELIFLKIHIHMYLYLHICLNLYKEKPSFSSFLVWIVPIIQK